MSKLSTERLKNLQVKMVEQELDLVAIGPTANMVYLLGFAPLADERPTYLLVTPDSSELVVPTLNADQVESRTGQTVIRWTDVDGPQHAIGQALDAAGARPGGVLAVDDSLRSDAFLLLQRLARPARSVTAGEVMADLRLRKSAAELELLAQAAAMADGAVLAGAAACRPGVTEREVANEIDRHFRANGAEKVDFLLVASGPNGAFPHHDTGNRKLQSGDTVVIDIGATLNGYKSDITRVVQLGQPSQEVQKVYDLVRAANRAGREAAVAGAAVADVDRATRTIIEQAGYGEYFFHRTGHGLGLEIHELPSITSENEMILKPGMVFSVEPGIYLPGKFGIRIEDIVAVTEAGACRRLTGLGHELIVREETRST